MPEFETIPVADRSEYLLRIQQAFKLALSMVLLYWLALTLNWDLPKYGALAIALISLDTTGASLNKGIMRIVGTTIGLGVGLLGLAWFAQDSWATLAYQAGYLVVVGYFMQSSRYPYAWFVAGFLPSLVWATTYGKIDSAFSYATFRYLETTAGIVIYTAVSAMIWPRRAGDTLDRQGREFWRQLRELFGLYGRQLATGQAPEYGAARRARLAATASQMFSTLGAAYADTPAVATRKSVWESFRVNTRATGGSMELWRQSIEDCRHLDLNRLVPEFHSLIEVLGRRLRRIDAIWLARSAGEAVADSGDHDRSLLDLHPLKLTAKQAVELSHFDRAALLSFIQQLNLLDRSSRELLRTMRILTGWSEVPNDDSDSIPADRNQFLPWDGPRLTHAMLPAVSWIAAWCFWIHFDPPTGPSVPNMAATFGLLAVLTPMNMLKLILPAMISVLVFVAPIYFLVMPRLSTGMELLVLIFGFAFIARTMLIGRLTGLRTITLAAFVMMTGISNVQSYSFTAIVNGAMMLMLGLVIVGMVQTIMSPMKPEREILDAFRRFCRGCMRITSGYAPGGVIAQTVVAQERARRNRQQYLNSMVLPAPAKIQAAQRNLDERLYPDNRPEKVQRLTAALHGISNRLQALEAAHQRFRDDSQLAEITRFIPSELRESLINVFARWARLEPGDAMAEQQAQLQRLARDLEKQLDILESRRSQRKFDDRFLKDVYALIGTVRGLVDSMTNAQLVINQLNWQQWATSRF